MPGIPLYSNSSMQATGRHKEFPEIRLYEVTVVAVRIVLHTSTCLGLNNLAEVRITFLVT